MSPTPTGNLFFPFFSWNAGQKTLYPQRVRESFRDQRTTEKNIHVAGSGKIHTYLVGSRRFFELTFPKQSDAKRDEWLAFWDDVKDGRLFNFYHDDSYFQVGDVGLQVNDNKVGELKTQGVPTPNRNKVRIDMDTFEPTEDPDVWGQWTIFIRLREQT